MSERPMTIERLEVSGFKRIRTVSIEANGNDVALRGRNAQGKSSVFDAIEAALFGRDAIPDDPVNRDADRAEIRVDLGDVIVVREIRLDGKHTLRITSRDPAQVSTQAWLDARLGARSFDPSSILRLKPREQAQMLRDALGIDTKELDAQRARYFEDRTISNREAARLEGALVQAPFPDGPDEPVDVSALANELAAMTRKKVENDQRRAACATAEAAATAAIERASAAKRAYVEAQEAEMVAITAMNEAREVLRGLVDPDTDPIAAKLGDASRLNEVAAQRARRRELADNLATMMGESAHLTSRIEEIDEAKKALLESSSFPIPNLAIVDDAVYLNGAPLENASQAERLRLQVALWLAQNPGIRVLLLRDASLLDEDSRAAIAGMVHEAGGQVWEEIVGTDGDGIVIEDGRVVPAGVAL